MRRPVRAADDGGIPFRPLTDEDVAAVAAVDPESAVVRAAFDLARLIVGPRQGRDDYRASRLARALAMEYAGRAR